MDKKIGQQGIQSRILNHFKWPMLITLILILFSAGVFVINVYAGIYVMILLIVYVAVVTLIYWRRRELITSELINFAMGYGQIQKRILKELHVPYALLDENGDIIWMNNSFSAAVGKERSYRKNISTIFEEVSMEWLQKADQDIMTIEHESRIYRIEMYRMAMDSESAHDNQFDVSADISGNLIGMYLYDETELQKIKTEVEDQRAVMGQLYLDNYDEALETIEEVRRSLLLALIDRRINKYFTNFDGIVRKVEADKYFVILKDRAFREIKKNKFSLIQEVKTVNIGNDMAVTLSMGFGIGGKTYSENYEYSRAAIDLALGRGGDQVVIKSGDHNEYFGGKTKQIDRNTRVKARVKAHALREIMEANEKIFIMGHAIPDADCFGAAVGVQRAAKTINRKAYVVVDDTAVSIRPLVQRFREMKDFDPELFISGERALELVDSSSAVVVVDVNKPSLCECPELLERTKNIVVFDHHRQGSEVIRNAVLAYIEPYASSACEMVAEMLQYFDENIRMKNVEADSIYAGMMIDTNNFVTKTGVRTFEAAAYLRRCGADVTRVRRMFREDMATNKVRAAMILDAEVYKERFVITVCPSEGEGLETPTVVGAQTANELLNIIGIRASFVLNPYKQQIYVSARSLEDINVQRIMERLGGGGHLTTAGAQLSGCTVEEARKLIHDTIDQMEEEGEL